MFSLVIPTHNRAPILRRTLTHLFTLQEIQACEVIVVNDGSTDDTAAVLSEFQRAFPTVLRSFEVANGGPGHARNRGVEAAQNERILFIDDDVFPRAGMLQSHWRLLDQGYVGSQGILVWHPEIERTRLIRYIDSRRMQFAFHEVKNPSHLEFQYVYTGNFAVIKQAVIDAGGFDSRFFNREHRFSAYEDTILGYKLVQNEAKLALNQEAIADHLHDMNEDGCVRREFKVGYAVGLLRQEYPAIAEQLGFTRRHLLAGTQARLLGVLNGTGIVKHVLGYSLDMRLRQREASYRGFLCFQREVEPTGMPATQ